MVLSNYLKIELRALQAVIWILDEIALLHRTDELEALESAKHKKILEV